MTQAQKQIVRNMRIQSNSLALDPVEKAIVRHTLKEAKPLMKAVRALHKQIRAEVDAQLSAAPSWEKMN